MRILTFSLFILLVFIIALSSGRTTSSAYAATIIGFSEYPPGTFINTQYGEKGIVFSGPGTDPVIVQDGGDQKLSGDPFSHEIRVTFVAPFDFTQHVTARHVSFEAGRFDAPHRAEVVWFDLDSNRLDSKDNSQGGIESFSIPGNIGSFIIRTTTNLPGGFAIDNLSFEINAPTVDIIEADITKDLILVGLNSQNASGRFVLTLVGDTNRTLFDATLASRSTPYTFHFDPEKLPVGQYTSVEAVWTVNGTDNKATTNHAFRVLGKYHHTQYNTPDELGCKGPPVGAFITNADCAFTPTDLLREFISQVNLNGSGRSIVFGDVQREVFCLRGPRRPPGSVEHSFRQHAILPTCALTGLNDTTVARLPGHPFLDCTDRVLIVGLGSGTGTIKTVTDECPRCKKNQLDNYTTNPACSGIRDLGNFVTIRLR